MLLKKKIFYTLLILTIVGFLFYNLKDNNKQTAIEIGGSFELTNHLGEEVTNKSFKNNYQLIFFGFTNCPDFCPNTLNNIGIIIEKIDKKNQLVPIFITVDPKRDTVSKLKKYLANFHPKIIGLTGTNDQIENVKKKYKIFSKKVMDMEKKNENSTNHAGHDHGGYGVDHTTIIYLMDKRGNYITHFSPDTSNLEMAKKINQYL